jgi:hypothetical protein
MDIKFQKCRDLEIIVKIRFLMLEGPNRNRFLENESFIHMGTCNLAVCISLHYTYSCVFLHLFSVFTRSYFGLFKMWQTILSNSVPPSLTIFFPHCKSRKQQSGPSWILLKARFLVKRQQLLCLLLLQQASICVSYKFPQTLQKISLWIQKHWHLKRDILELILNPSSEGDVSHCDQSDSDF